MEQIKGFQPLMGEELIQKIEDRYIIGSDNDFDIGINIGLALAIRIIRGESV